MFNSTKRKITIISVCIIAIIINCFWSIGGNAYNLSSDLTINEYLPTNGDISIMTKVTDANLKNITLPNGGVVYSDASYLTISNGSYIFYLTDKYNEVSKRIIEIKNIDKTPPDVPSVKFPNEINKNVTNKDIEMEINYPQDAFVKYYKIGKSDSWQNYKAKIILKGNETIFFKCSDTANNWSAMGSYSVSNIDKVTPTINGVNIIDNLPTNGSVRVKTYFPMDSIKNEYLLYSSLKWNKYQNEILLKTNDKVSFKCTDLATNISKIETYSIRNIDKIAPNNSEMILSNNLPTNKDIEIVIKYPKDAVNKYYKTAQAQYKSYIRPIIVRNNLIINTENIDVAGNSSSVNTFKVLNIDKIAPNTASISSSTTEFTNMNVLLYAEYPKDGFVKQYRLTNNGVWANYIDSVDVEENVRVYFRSFDIANNVSKESYYDVKNIDKIAPEAKLTYSETEMTNKNVLITLKPTDNYSGIDSIEMPDKQILKLNGELAIQFIVSKNGKYSFKIWDKAKNYKGVIADVKNIDKVNPFIKADLNTLLPTNKDVTMKIESSDNYSGIKSILLPDKKNTNLSAINFISAVNGNYTSVVTDRAGNYTSLIVNVNNIDKETPKSPSFLPDKRYPTNQNIMMTINYPLDAFAKEYRIGVNGIWTNYIDKVEIKQNCKVFSRTFDIAGNPSNEMVFSIENIDKVPPTKLLVELIDRDTVVLKGSIDEGLGLEGYWYQINNEESKRYSSQIKLQDGIYTIICKSIDIANNQSITKIQIQPYKELYNKAIIAIPDCEKNQTQSKVDIARDLLLAFPDVQEKYKLMERVDRIQCIINIEFMMEQLTNLEEILNSGNYNAEALKSIRNQIDGLMLMRQQFPSDVKNAKLDNFIKSVDNKYKSITK